MMWGITKKFLPGFLGGALGAIFLLFWLNLPRFNNFASLIFNNLKMPANTREIIKEIVVKDPDFWKNVFEKVRNSVVLIQAFRGDNLIFQSSGIVLTDDGLVVAPSGALDLKDKIQIFAGDKIISGNLVFSDKVNGLALIRVSGIILKPVELTPSVNIAIAQEGLIVGNSFKVNSLKPFVQSALVKDKDSIISYLDIPPGSNLQGTGFFSSGGQLIGLANLNNKGSVFVYNSDLLQKLLERYISSK